MYLSVFVIFQQNTVHSKKCIYVRQVFYKQMTQINLNSYLGAT